MKTPPRNDAPELNQDVADLPAPLSIDGTSETTLVTPALPPRVIDHTEYNISGEIGRGGIGRVLLATDARLKREVAIKELMRTGGAAAQRFWRETMLTSQLQHPSIVPIYEAGKWIDGTPFYSMRLVSGKDLYTAIQDAEDLSARLALLPHVIAACEAIAYAHSKNIIHRDLKPQNILIGAFGETVVIDWGIAKDLSSSSSSPSANLIPTQEIKRPEPMVEDKSGSQSSDAFSTQAGSILGTPAYMPIEQAKGQDVDTRADVYALGAILYCLLSGEPPYQGKNARIVHKKVLDGPPPPLKDQWIPSDLLDIVAKAMAREADDRYPTARELVFDLNKFSTGQLVSAHRYTLRELFIRFYQKHMLAVWVGFLAVTALLFGGSVAINQIRQERDRADDERRNAKQLQRDAELLRDQETLRADELTLLQARVSLRQDPTASLSWLRSLSQNKSLAPRLRMIASEALSRGVSRVLLGHDTGTVGHAIFSPDNKWIASASDDNTVRLWEVSSGKGTILGKHSDEAWNLSFSPDSKWLISGGKDKTVHLWDLINGQNKTFDGFSGAISGVHFSPNQRFFAVTSSNDSSLYIYEWPSLTRRVFSGHASRIRRTAISPDGARIATAADNTILLWDPITGVSQPLLGHTDTVIGLKFFPDGKRLASAGADKTVRIWELSTMQSTVLTGSSSVLWLLEISPDGKWLAGISDDLSAHLWSAETGAYTPLTGAERALHSIRFSPDSGLVAATSDDSTVRIWDIRSGQRQTLYGHRGGGVYVDFSPDGKWLLSTSSDATIRLWEVKHDTLYTDAQCLDALLSADGQALYCLTRDDAVRRWGRTKEGWGAPTSLRAAGAPWKSLREELSQMNERFSEGHSALAALSHDQRWLAAASSSNTVHLWDLNRAGAPPVVVSTHSAAITSLRLSSDGQWLASSSLDKRVSLYNLTTRESRELSADAPLLALDLSLSGDLVTASSVGGDVYLWRTSGELVAKRHPHEGTVRCVLFSPGGALIASAGDDHKLNLWDYAQDKSESLAGYPQEIASLAFAPDESHLAAAGGSTDVWLWDLSTKSPTQLTGHKDGVQQLVFSSDSETLVSAGLDGAVFLWDRADDFSGRALRRHTAPVSVVLLSSDGSQIFSVSQDKTVIEWPNDLPRDWEELQGWLSTRLSALTDNPVWLRE